MKDNEIIQKIFDFKNISLGRNGWMWWFWLFFFKNPLNPQKPRQVAVLWSAKNDAEIKCNGAKLCTKNPLKKDGLLHGGVAAWYFDGVKMHENILLDKVKIKQTPFGLSTSSPDTTFEFKNGYFQINLENKMKFKASLIKGRNKFVAPWIGEYKKFKFGYQMIGVNRFDLKATINGEQSTGTAYFQKVFLNFPAIPWFWGVFHFKKGACLSYFNPYFLGKSVKKDVSFYDGKAIHKFNNARVERTSGSLPVFHVKAEDNEKTIEFSVETYSEAAWKFRKKKIGFIPVKFDYREYPARVTNFKFKDLKNNLTISKKDIGIGIGNAEHSIGLLI